MPASLANQSAPHQLPLQVGHMHALNIYRGTLYFADTRFALEQSLVWNFSPKYPTKSISRICSAKAYASFAGGINAGKSKSNVLITGVSSGIGQATAVLLADKASVTCSSGQAVFEVYDARDGQYHMSTVMPLCLMHIIVSNVGIDY